MSPKTFSGAAIVFAVAGPALAQPPADPHAGHNAPAAPPAAGVPAPTTTAPPAPTDRAADAFFDSAAMERARATLRLEHGGARTSQFMAERLEYRSGDSDGYNWDLKAWIGGDINRLVLRSEGEAASGEGVETAELQALWSRAVGPYTDLQLGVRQDLEPGARTFLTAGFETLAPYWFEIEGAAFLSDRGDLTARLEGHYDLRLTQRLVLQPQAELNVSAQDAPDLGLGAGLTAGEVGLRLRYEIRREFAPYIGVVYERRFGDTADRAKTAGEDVSETSLVVGVRGWF